MSEELSVKAMTRLTGVNEHTLRAWERRYGAVRPQRSSNGRRTYTRLDVDRLRHIAALVERGFSIGRIARLSDRELAELVAAQSGELTALELAGKSGVTGDQPAAGPAQIVMERIHALLCDYNLAAIHSELQTARHLLGVRQFALDLITPLMAMVRRMTMVGTLSIGQEHALSAMVKAHLSTITLDMSSRALADNPGLCFVLSTMEGDFHELGIMIAAVLCTMRGAAARYLGPNIPALALADTANAFKADHLVLGSAPVPPGTLVHSEIDYLQQLDAKLRPNCQIWLGGHAEGSLPQLDQHQVHGFTNLPAFDAWLGQTLGT